MGECGVAKTTMNESEIHGDPSLEMQCAPEEVKVETLTLTESQRAAWDAKILLPTTEGGCHLWIASLTRKGYGNLRIGRDTFMAHRVAYMLHCGPIPEGMCVCHRCDVRNCVRPDHLFLGTNEDNVADRVAKGRTAKGDKHGANTKPELHCRGDRHPTRTRPEEVLRIGEDNPHHKITENDVREIRARYAAGETQTALAKEFGVSSMNVSNICRFKKWARVK